MLRKLVRMTGFDIVRYRSGKGADIPSDVSADDREILRRVAGYTLTSLERQLALIQAVRHVVRAGIPGCVTECGVWRGGSMMAVALALIQEQDTTRDLYLFDTFEGMSAPTPDDRTADGKLAQDYLDASAKGAGYWCTAQMEDVGANMAGTQYPR